MAARREEGKPGLHLLLDVPARPAEERLESPVEAELAPVLADEVEDQARGLASVLPQAAAELLEEQGGAVRRAQQEERVDVGQVHALVEEVDGEENGDFAAAQPVERGPALLLRAVAPDGCGRNAGLLEHPGHEPRVVDTHAEAEGTHGAEVVHVAPELAQHEVRPQVVPGVNVRERLHVVPAPAPPRDFAEIDAVMEPVVLERNEPALVDGVPETKLGRNSAAEPVEDRQAVGPFRRRRETEELAGRDVVEERPVRRRRPSGGTRRPRRRRSGRAEVLELTRRQALDGREHVLPPFRPAASHPELAEPGLPQRLAHRWRGSGPKLLAVRDEEESTAPEAFPEAGVVHGGHDRLACARGGDQEVPVLAALARHLDLLEETLLEGLEADLDRRQNGPQLGLGLRGTLQELRLVEGHEVAAFPVRFEDGGDLRHEVGVARAGGAHVPLEPAHLRRVGEVRRADIGGRGDPRRGGRARPSRAGE